MMRMLTIGLLAALVAACEPSTTGDCTPATHCHLQNGVPVCDDGYVPDGPYDPDNLRCVPACTDGVDCAGGCPATADCAGRQCGPDPVCGVSCGTCAAGNCNLSGQCVTACEPGPETTAARCNDGCSNDGDDYVDCDDRDCCAVVSGCPTSTYCGREAGGDESTAAACSNSADDDGDGAIDCEDVDCCDGTCPLDSGCNPMWCLDGIGELLTIPWNGDPTTLVQIQTTTINSWGDFDPVGHFVLYAAGVDISWRPSAQVPYAKSCIAVDQFARSLPCTVSIHAQSWETDAGCGAMRGSIELDDAQQGITYVIDFASAVALPETAMDFE